MKERMYLSDPRAALNYADRRVQDIFTGPTQHNVS